MTFAPADMTDEAFAALSKAGRGSDLLTDLAEFGAEAVRVAQEFQTSQTGRKTRLILACVLTRLMAAAGRLVMLSVKVWHRRGFPAPRAPRPAEQAPQDPQARRTLAAPAARAAAPRVRLVDLVALGIPGAEALRDRLAAMLAEPDMADLLASEPAARRAAAPLARAFGLRLARPPAAAEPKPAAASAKAAPRAPARKPPPPEGWVDYKAGAGPLALPFAMPEAARDPPAPWRRPPARPEGPRSRLLRSAYGWA